MHAPTLRRVFVSLLKQEPGLRSIDSVSLYVLCAQVFLWLFLVGVFTAGNFPGIYSWLFSWQGQMLLAPFPGNFCLMLCTVSFVVFRQMPIIERTWRRLALLGGCSAFALWWLITSWFYTLFAIVTCETNTWCSHNLAFLLYFAFASTHLLIWMVQLLFLAILASASPSFRTVP